MNHILRTNRNRLPELLEGRPTPSTNLQILLFSAFAAEMNLSHVGRGLVERDRRVFAEAPDRNAKLARIQAYLKEQAEQESSDPRIDCQAAEQSRVASKIAGLIEKIGRQTVELAKLCERAVSNPEVDQAAQIGKLMEHVVFILDAGTAAFVYRELPWARAAFEEAQTAATFYQRIGRDLDLFLSTNPEAAPRLNPLRLIASKTSAMLPLAAEVPALVAKFLESRDRQPKTGSRLD